MKTFLDFVITMLNDYKDKEYTSSRDMVNHRDEYDYYRGKNEAYKEVLQYLQFTLNSNKDSKMDAIRKEITELYRELRPITVNYIVATLKRYIKDETSMQSLNLYIYDGEEQYESDSSGLGNLKDPTRFIDVAELLVKNAEDSQTGSIKLHLYHNAGLMVMSMNSELYFEFETDELPF